MKAAKRDSTRSARKAAKRATKAASSAKKHIEELIIRIRYGCGDP